MYTQNTTHISLQRIEADFKQKIETEGLHRKQNGSLTTIISTIQIKKRKIENQITHTKINIGNTTTTIRKLTH